MTGLVQEFARNAQVETKAELESSFLADLVRSFDNNPIMARRAIRELLAKAPQKFYAAALQLLKTGLSGAGGDFLISLLLENELLLLALSDPDAFPSKTAAGLAANLHRVDQQLDAKLMRQVMKDGNAGREPDEISLLHVLEIVDEISDCSRLVPFLMKLSKHGNKKIRSKAIMLLVRAHRNSDWLQQQLAVEDPRYRSNAIEGMLYAQAGEKEIQLLWAAAADGHHRVATTALRVLHHFGQQDAIEQILEFVRHPSELFRAAAAWALGEIGDRHYLEVLQGMAKSDTGLARRAAIKSAVKLRALPEKTPEPAAHAHTADSHAGADSSDAHPTDGGAESAPSGTI